MSAGKKKTVSLLCIAITCVALLAWIGCANPGGGGSSESVTTTIKGTTLYSADGGATTQPANFQFDVPTTATKGVAPRGSSDWIAVTGQIRAGDILINLSGTFNTTTKEFNLRASGLVLSIRIDMTIKGLYTPSTGTISQGQTDVAVTDTTTGVTQTYSTSTVKEGQDVTKPIADAPTVATPPTAAQTKFWEGVWAGDATMYFNSDGSPSSAPTSIYLKQTFSLTCTATQFQERIVESNTFPSTWSYSPSSFYQTGIFLTATMDETTPNLVIGIVQATQYNDSGTTDHGYMKVYGTLTSAGKLTGGGYYSIDPHDGHSVYIFPTIPEAQAATIQDTSANNLVVSRID
jgi:hypothetical protein